MFRRHRWTVVLLGAVSLCNVARAQDDMLPPGDLPLPEVQASPGMPLAKEGVYLPTREWYGAANPPVGQATGGSFLGGTHIGSPYNWNGPGSPPVGAYGGTFGWTGNGWRGYGANGGGGYHGGGFVGGGRAGYGYAEGVYPADPSSGSGYAGNAYVGGGYGGHPVGGNSVGSPYGAYGVNGPAGPSDPYVYHFGPGFHRHSNYGHYRFPYYNYRAPWYFSGSPSYHRDTNHPW